MDRASGSYPLGRITPGRISRSAAPSDRLPTQSPAVPCSAGSMREGAGAALKSRLPAGPWAPCHRVNESLTTR